MSKFKKYLVLLLLLVNNAHAQTSNNFLTIPAPTSSKDKTFHQFFQQDQFFNKPYQLSYTTPQGTISNVWCNRQISVMASGYASFSISALRNDAQNIPGICLMQQHWWMALNIVNHVSVEISMCLGGIVEQARRLGYSCPYITRSSCSPDATTWNNLIHYWIPFSVVEKEFQTINNTPINPLPPTYNDYLRHFQAGTSGVDIWRNYAAHCDAWLVYLRTLSPSNSSRDKVKMFMESL